MIDVQSGRGREPEATKDELTNEAVAIVVVLMAVLISIALISENNGSNLVGRMGTVVSGGLTYAVGRYVAFLIPFLILATGVLVWKNNSFPKAGIRIIGLYGTMASVCSLLAIPHAEVVFEGDNGFRDGGALGNYLVHTQCLNLAGMLGTVGAYLLFSSLLIISLSTAADVTIKDFITGLKKWAGSQKWRHFMLPLAAVFSGRTAAQEQKPDADIEQGMAVPLHNGQQQQTPGGNPETYGRGSRLAASEPAAGYAFSPEPVPVQAQASACAQSATTGIPATITATAASPAVTQVSMEACPGLSISVDDCDDDLFSMAESGEKIQGELALVKPYETPHFTILNAPPTVVNAMSNEEVAEICDRLEKTLAEFNITANVVQVTQGPTVTRYEIQPAPGVKVAKIASLENDITMCMKAESVRIIAPVPGKGTVGLEIPNKKSKPVFLREMLETDAFRNHPSPLAFALGMTISGEPFISDLAAMPHVLIAGRTGSGKSVCLNSIICSILFRMTPDKVKFLMVDPKRVELNVYQAIPHLLAPVVCEPRKAAAALTWAVEQMDDRYKKLAALGVRNIDGYNAIVQSGKPHPKAVGRKVEYMPHIVIVIDELADLMLIARNEVEDNIIRLAQMSRAVGMHLILATQRPSVNVITGIIKANFPSRVAFQVSSKVDSRTILDAMGAEALLGRGDMLFSPGGSPKPIRLQGCYLSDQEVEATADWVRSQAKAQYEMQDFLTKKEQEELRVQQNSGYGSSDMLSMDGIDADDSRVSMNEDDDDYDYSYQQERRDGRSVAEVMGRVSTPPRASSGDESDAIDEELFGQAARLILTHRKASVSLLQRKLKIGFARAGRVMDMLEEREIVGPNVGSKVRDILVDPDEYLAEIDQAGDDEVRF